jgi:hypothetical protein
MVVIVNRVATSPWSLVNDLEIVKVLLKRSERWMNA